MINNLREALKGSKPSSAPREKFVTLRVVYPSVMFSGEEQLFHLCVDHDTLTVYSEGKPAVMIFVETYNEETQARPDHPAR
jgi:hypothetical protein